MPYKDKEKNREYQREWSRRNQKKRREYRRKIRLQVLQLLGGQCVYCGCVTPDALEINHINGGGTKMKPYPFHLAILRGDIKDELELTCAICNTHHRLVKLQGIEDRWTISYH